MTPKANGLAERAVRESNEQLRVTKLALECRIDVKIRTNISSLASDFNAEMLAVDVALRGAI